MLQLFSISNEMNPLCFLVKIKYPYQNSENRKNFIPDNRYVVDNFFLQSILYTLGLGVRMTVIKSKVFLPHHKK